MEASAFIVPRHDIHAITQVEIQGIAHDLGEHRDFRRHQALAEFLPSHGRISISWTRLVAGQELAVHQHPTKSMIIVTGGRGKLLGDAPRELCEGDVVAVPAGVEHGFLTDRELVALSLQFEGVGLYEDEHSARVSFVDNFCGRLVKHQEDRLESHVSIPFFRMLNDGTLEDTECRVRFLSCLHQWSSAFQRMMFLRQGLVHGTPWESLFLRHFYEELGHNDLLARESQISITRADSAIESCASWFLYRTLVGDNLERLVVTHLVLERSAHAFHGLASHIFPSSYFAEHAIDDDVHHNMGLAELQGMTAEMFQRLLSVSEKAWDVLELMLERMVQIIREDSACSISP